MHRISLIVTSPCFDASEARLVRVVQALSERGHAVEVIAGTPIPRSPDGHRPRSPAAAGTPHRSRAASALAGIRASVGEWIVVVDLAEGYTPRDVLAVVDALESGAAEVVVGSRAETAPGLRTPTPVRRIAGAVSRRAVGSSDPLSSLVGLTRAAFVASDGDVHAFGSHYTLELLTKAEDGCRDVPARPDSPHGRQTVLPTFDDIRHFKHVADHRYGNLSRLVQFCAVGASGMVIDLSCYALFQWLFRGTALAARRLPVLGPLDLVLAAVLAVGLALTWNFSLNRRLTFSYARQGSLLVQYGTYALSNALAILVNLAIRLRLPQYVAFFAAHKLAAAVVGIVLATGISFSMSRWLVFRHRQPPADPEPARRGTPRREVLAQTTAR